MTYKIPITLFVLALLLCFEAARVLEIGGIAPDLVLIFFVVLFTATKFGRSLTVGEFATCILFVCAASAILFRFWFPEMLTVSCVVALIYVLRNKAIGTPALDLLLFLVAGTLLLYGALAVMNMGGFSIKIALEDAAYTALLGLISWSVVRYISYA